MTDFERIPAGRCSHLGADNERILGSAAEPFGHAQRDLHAPPGLRLDDGPGRPGHALPSPAGHRAGKQGEGLVNFFRNYPRPDDDIRSRHLTTAWVATLTRTSLRS